MMANSLTCADDAPIFIQSYFLGTWATEYETKDPSEISVL